MTNRQVSRYHVDQSTGARAIVSGLPIQGAPLVDNRTRSGALCSQACFPAHSWEVTHNIDLPRCTFFDSAPGTPPTADILHSKFGAGLNGMRGRFLCQWLTLVWEGVFLLAFTYMTQLSGAIVCLILFSCGVQASEGTSFGIVPYICPAATGAVAGIVGAGGNIGAIAFGLVFRFGPASAKDVFRIMAACILGLSCLTPLLRIPGHASIFGSPRGEPDSISEI